MSVIYIGIGSNLGSRESHLLRAIDELRAVGRVLRISTVFETKPEGVSEEQPDFLNAVAEIETGKPPREVLNLLLRIEAEMGRVRAGKGRAREIDLDLLACGNEVVSESGLIVPHPRMHRRRFVLEPLSELAPEWRHPLEKKTVAEMLEGLSAD